MSRPIVTEQQWRAAHRRLLDEEKAATRARDALAAERRRMPMLEVTRSYRFTGPAGELAGAAGPGEVGLPELFDGARQLIVYRHMLRPADPEPCTGCSMFVDNLGHPAHLRARDTRLVLVSAAPIDEIAAFRDRMGWRLPWYSTTDEFQRDFDVADGFGLNVFLRDGGRIFRTYFTTGRGVEALGSTWTLLDLTPLGRQETWEDSPPGTPQTPPYEWWRLHDSYG